MPYLRASVNSHTAEMRKICKRLHLPRIDIPFFCPFVNPLAAEICLFCKRLQILMGHDRGGISFLFLERGLQVGYGILTASVLLDNDTLPPDASWDDAEAAQRESIGQGITCAACLAIQIAAKVPRGRLLEN
jgi:hypothetical protein